MPTTELPSAPTPSNPANAPAVRYKKAEEQALMEALSLEEIDGSVVAAADLLEIDRDRAKKIVTRALARTLKLPEVQGNIAAAAAKLGLHYMAAYKLCLKNDFLSATHPSRDPDSMTVEQLDTIARTAILTREEIAEIEAVEKQNKMLSARDFDGLGLNQERVSDLLTLEKFAQRPISNMIDLTHGGSVYCFMELVDLLKKYKKKLDGGDLPVEFNEAGHETNTERDWVMTLVSLSAEIRQINNQVQRSNILRLKAKELDRNKGEGSGRSYPTKPGFTPMVAVQVNSNDKKTEVNVRNGP